MALHSADLVGHRRRRLYSAVRGAPPPRSYAKTTAAILICSRRIPHQRLAPDSFFTGVDNKTVSAQKSNEREAVFARETDRKARRSRDRRNDRDPGDERLLNDLEAASPADEQDMIRQWETLLEH